MSNSRKKSNLDTILEQEQRLLIEKELAIKKAYQSNDVDQILKATQYIKGSQKKEQSNMKAIFMDPYDPGTALGYKDKSYSISYDLLRGMARTHVVKAVIETRKDQVAAFCEPQQDKYSTGFIVRKKDSNYFLPDKSKKKDKSEEATIVKITEFLLNCGNIDNKWGGDTFDSFVRKVISDSLTMDAATFEIARNRKGELTQFQAVDGATIRIAATYDDENFEQKQEIINGHKPKYVQVIDGKPIMQFYPWELAYGIRNPSTALNVNGYGRGELEDLIQTVTSLLNSDTYNANFFKVGSAPKGILTYTGNLNENSLAEFREQWMVQTAGVHGMHKTPIINADKMNFINTHVPNKDMEFSKFQEFLIKIVCAIYKIDPSEIGFPMSGNANPGALSGEGNNETKLKYSRDKGLKPLLKQLQYWLNHYIVSEIDPAYEIVFTGISGETTFEQELDNNVKMLQNFKTLNEMRKEYGLPPIKGGDIVLNPIAFQQAMAQQQQEANQVEEENPFGKAEFFEQDLSHKVTEIFEKARLEKAS